MLCPLGSLRSLGGGPASLCRPRRAPNQLPAPQIPKQARRRQRDYLTFSRRSDLFGPLAPLGRLLSDLFGRVFEIRHSFTQTAIAVPWRAKIRGPPAAILGPSGRAQDTGGTARAAPFWNRACDIAEALHVVRSRGRSAYSLVLPRAAAPGSLPREAGAGAQCAARPAMHWAHGQCGSGRPLRAGQSPLGPRVAQDGDTLRSPMAAVEISSWHPGLGTAAASVLGRGEKGKDVGCRVRSRRMSSGRFHFRHTQGSTYMTGERKAPRRLDGPLLVCVQLGHADTVRRCYRGCSTMRTGTPCRSGSYLD